jgi:hypothetical protein
MDRITVRKAELSAAVGIFERKGFCEIDEQFPQLCG